MEKMDTQPGVTNNDTKPSTFTLDVRNLPLDLEKAGVLSIFNEYGKVTGIMLLREPNKQTNQAYISYSTYIEAEQAFSALHEELPLELSIKFKERHLKNLQLQEKINVDLSAPFIDHRYNKSHLDDIKGQKKAIDMGKVNCTSSLLDNKTYSSDDELLYPIPTDPHTFNPYDSKGPYHETNLMYTRGVAQIMNDGRRRIAYGRGYTFYDLPEPQYNIGDLVQKECERREKGLYEYAEEDLEDEIKNCNVCSTPTAFRCQKCDTAFYCSKSCQVKDWPGHKLNCQPVPPLIKKLRKSTTPVQNGHKTVVPSHVSELPMPTALRRPRLQPQPVEQVTEELQSLSTQIKEPAELQHHERKQQTQVQTELQTQSQPIYQQQHNQPQPVNQQSASELKQEKTTSSQSSTKQIRNCNNNNHIIDENKNDLNKQKQSFNFKADSSSFPAKPQQQQQNQSQHKIKPTIRDDNIGFQSHTFIPKDKFVEVNINSVVDKGQGIYYVQKPEDWQQIEELINKIEKYAVCQKLVEPQENVMCIVENEGVWFRSKIIKIDDRIMHVFYVDFGTYEDLALHPVCPIDAFEEIPFFSKKIKVNENSDKKFKNFTSDQALKVKAVSLLEDGTILVEAKEAEEINSEQNDSELIVDKLKSIPNLLETLKINDKGLMLMYAQLSFDEYSVTIIPEDNMNDFQELITPLANDCEAQLEKYPSFNPKVGELVCGKNENNEWFRGIVLMTKPVKLGVIDESKILLPVACTPIPDKYRDMVMFGFIFKYIPTTKVPSDLTIDTVTFVVTETMNKTKDSVLIRINTEDGKFGASGLLKKWIPKTEQKALSWALLNNGKEIKIIDYSSPNVFFVRSLEPQEFERTQRLDQDIAEYAQNKKALAEFPVVGQIVLAYFDLDENYYRAIITKIDGENIEIKYIDYGNNHKVTFKDLYMLPEKLKEQPSCITKIKLKDIPEKPLNDDVNNYIQELISAEAALVCTFTGHPFSDGVELKSSIKNEIVNAKMIELLKPTWEKENSPDDKSVYQIHHCLPLKLGDIGDQVVAMPLAYFVNSNLVMMGPNDIVAAEAQEQMDNRIQEYVKTTDTHYIPREKELCIAKYMDTYYRALCMDPSATPTQCRVFFLDWGNTELVEHKDIRLITKDFLQIGAYVTPCSLSTICSESAEHEKIRQKIDEIIGINEPVEIKLIEYDETGILIIDIPHLRAQLLEEKLF